VTTQIHVSDDDGRHSCFTIGLGQKTTDWFVDSGASTHMTNNLSFFTALDKTKTDKIYIANGYAINADGIGNGFLDCMLDDGKVCRILMKDVLYAPMLTGSLLSLKKLTDKGKTVEFRANRCYIIESKKLLAIGKLEDNLYKLTCKLDSMVANVA